MSPSDCVESGVVTPFARTSPAGKLIVDDPGRVFAATGRTDTNPADVWPTTVRLPVIAVASVGTPQCPPTVNVRLDWPWKTPDSPVRTMFGRESRGRPGVTGKNRLPPAPAT